MQNEGSKRNLPFRPGTSNPTEAPPTPTLLELEGIASPSRGAASSTLVDGAICGGPEGREVGALLGAIFCVTVRSQERADLATPLAVNLHIAWKRFFVSGYTCCGWNRF